MNTTEHLFTGRWNKQYDTTSTLVLMGARPYDPSLGRFLAVDPIDGGSLNNYDYAGQDPINGYDLSGQMLEAERDAADVSAITITYPTGDHGTDTITFIAVSAGPHASVVGAIHIVKNDGYWRTYATAKIETDKPVKSGSICTRGGKVASGLASIGLGTIGSEIGGIAGGLIGGLLGGAVDIGCAIAGK